MAYVNRHGIIKALAVSIRAIYIIVLYAVKS